MFVVMRGRSASSSQQLDSVVMGPCVRRDNDKGIFDMSNSHGPLRIGIGGPVGSGKTALMDLLCKAMRQRYDIAAITNDIYTKWDAEFLVRSGSRTCARNFPASTWC